MALRRKKHLGLYVSPWMIIGTTAILLLVVVVLAVNNYHREKNYMVDILLEKGAALITSFEAGARTGMRHMGWRGSQVQHLLEEIAKHPDVLYLAVTDEKGRILAHSDPQRIGKQFTLDFGAQSQSPGKSAQWRVRSPEDGGQAFEVYKYFRPIPQNGGHMGRMGGQRGPWCSPGEGDDFWCAPQRYAHHKQIIFIGFDPAPFLEARREDLRNTVILSAVLMVLGFAGFTTMFVTQNYQRTRRRLQDTSAVTGEVVANLPVGLLVMDGRGDIVLENPAAAEITGLPAREVQGRPAAEVLPPDLFRLMPAEEDSSRVLEQEVECRFAEDGEPVPLSVSTAGIVNDEGVHIGRLMILKDLKELKALQQAVQRKEKLAAIGGLAAGVAHEIRNPLSSVKGMATYFKNRFGADPEANEAAAVMVSETDRLNRVISELLEFARPSTIHAAPTRLNDIVDHSLRLIAPDAEGHRVRLDVHKADDLPFVDIDPDRFTQCLLNLYLNGIQAMDGEGGVLRIRTQPAPDGGAMIRVADTGAGIEAADVNQIFDPYFTTKASGTGLGLAIVHKIVENHNGRIVVDSTLGEGTAFTILLPASQTSAAENEG